MPFSFQSYPELFEEPEAVILKPHNVVALRRFVKHLKNRLASMENMANKGGWCGKLVKVNVYGKVKTMRCYGDTTSGRCFNCDNTGIDCAGDCGNDVTKAGDFCSSACKGMYYKF
jgi:hypothetical protein